MEVNSVYLWKSSGYHKDNLLSFIVSSRFCVFVQQHGHQFHFGTPVYSCKSPDNSVVL